MFKRLSQIATTLAVLGCSTLAYAQVATQILTNQSGGTVAQYSVIVLDSANDEAFTTTTTERATKICGIVLQSGGIADAAVGTVALFGIMDVKCTGAVTRGDYIITSTTGGSAKSGGTTNPNGSFGVALETGTGTNISSFVFPSAPSGGGPTELHLQDDVAMVWGTDNDIQATYDEAGDNRLEWDDGTNLLQWLTDAGTTGTGGVTGITWGIGDWLLAEGTGDFDFGPTADRDAFNFQDDGDLDIYGYFRSGIEDTKAGRFSLYGDNAAAGGSWIAQNSADEDTTYEFYIFEVNGLEARFGPDTDADAFTFDGDGDLHLTAGNLEVTGDLDVNGNDIDLGDAGGFSGLKFVPGTTTLDVYIDGTKVGHFSTDGKYTDDVA